MSVKQFAHPSIQERPKERPTRVINAHAPLRNRCAAATRSPSVVAPTAARLQGPRAVAPPRRSPTRPVRTIRSASSSALLRPQQRNLALAQNNLDKQMQLLNVTSPITKNKPRAASAGHPLGPTQPQKPPAGAFRRRPAAHLQALEASRKNKEASINAVAYKGRAKDACNSLRKILSGLAFKLDFATLDKFARNKGEEALKPLCQQLEQLNYLSQSFCRIVTSQEQRPLHSGRGPHSIQIKSFVVALQAIADKLPADMDADAAERLVEMVDQGLLEQILSWVGEAESSYDVVRAKPAAAAAAAATSASASAAAHAPARQPLAPHGHSHGTRPDLRRRVLSIGEKRPGAMVSESPRTESSEEEDDLSEEGWQRKQGRLRERMQRHRPPQLLIPETSFERNTRSRQ